MKSPIVIVLAGGIVLAAGTIVYFNRQEAPPAPSPTVESSAGHAVARSAGTGVPGVEPAGTVWPATNEPARVSALAPASDAPKTESLAVSAPPSTPFSRAIDSLVSPETSFVQRQAAWKQLRDAGQLDQAIAALTRGAAENPASAAYPAALGQAQLQKAGVVAQNGGTISEMGILGMQADQNFDAALKLDPANWEAQFFKAAAMSHWPLELNKGDEVIQRLSSLIDQQDAMTPEPQFAQTYVLLGDQYQKMGQRDYALATWQLGASKFPGDPTLQKKLNGR